MSLLDPAAAANVHYATDPRIRHLAEAAWRMRTGGTRTDWLMLGKNNPDALIAEAREWVRAAVAGGIIPPPSNAPAWKSAAHIAANTDDGTTTPTNVHIRRPCPHCDDRQMIPEERFDEHVALLHSDVKTGGLDAQQTSTDDVSRVIDLYSRWVQAGPPPIGTSLARWWDERLAELHEALLGLTGEAAIARALGGDRPAELIAHNLYFHGHSLAAIRHMTDTEFLAVPGISDTSLARIRRHIPQPTEQPSSDQTKE